MAYFKAKMHLIRFRLQQYSKITFFIFAVFDVRQSVAVNMCINCSFFTLIYSHYSQAEA